VKESGAPGNLNPEDAAAAERQRIVSEFRRREQNIEPDRYALWQPAEMFIRSSRARRAAAMLRSAGVFPGPGTACLEIGYGRIGWLAQLLSWGVCMEDIHGIELDGPRAADAQRRFRSADLRIGDATRLPWEDGSFRLVVVSMVFTSILDAKVRRLVADEILRVLAVGGALLWYDFRIDNPRNPHVRRVGRAELQALFPTLHGPIRSATLAPPLGRLVAPASWLLAEFLEALPFLRTHLLAVLVKGEK
jgi:ubiquinone/menaquinone biosynthesis C-methylase UbiE